MSPPTQDKPVTKTVSKLISLVCLLVIACSLAGCDLWIVNPAMVLRTSPGHGGGGNGEKVFQIVKDAIDVKIVGRYARDESRFWLINRLVPKRWAQFRISVENVRESNMNLSSSDCTVSARATVHQAAPEYSTGKILPLEKSFEFITEFSDIPDLDKDEPLLLKCTILGGENTKPLTIESLWLMAGFELADRDWKVGE